MTEKSNAIQLLAARVSVLEDIGDDGAAVRALTERLYDVEETLNTLKKKRAAVSLPADDPLDSKRKKHSSEEDLTLF